MWPNKTPNLEKYYQAIFDHSLDGIILTVTDGTVLAANPAACKILGRSEEEICTLGRAGILDITDPRFVAAAEERTNNGKVIAEFDFLHKDGHKITCEVSSNIFQDELGITYSTMVFRDISERKIYEELLKFSEEKFAKAFDANPHMMIISSVEEGRFFEVNEVFTKVMGYSKEEVIGRTSFDIGAWVYPEQRETMKSQLLSSGVVRDFEFEFRTKSGAIRIGLISAEAIQISNEKYCLMLVTDITQKKVMEKQILQMDRLNLIGQMAASISHEVRNPMTACRGFLQLLQPKLDNETCKQYVDIVIGELDRANKILSDFLSLAGNKVVVKQWSNLNEILNVLVPLIEANAFLYNNQFSFLPGEIPDLLLDENEIRQLLLNLSNNACEAMPNCGTLTISTYTDDKAVVLQVTDQGEGIEPHILEKIGTPFFTSKTQGNGLGLAICQQIASRHNACIFLKSSPTGTTVFVKFNLK